VPMPHVYVLLCKIYYFSILETQNRISAHVYKMMLETKKQVRVKLRFRFQWFPWRVCQNYPPSINKKVIVVLRVSTTRSIVYQLNTMMVKSWRFVRKIYVLRAVTRVSFYQWNDFSRRKLI